MTGTAISGVLLGCLVGLAAWAVMIYVYVVVVT